MIPWAIFAAAWLPGVHAAPALEQARSPSQAQVQAPATELTREQVAQTLTAAVTQIAAQYVDPVDTRALSVRGLRGLAALSTPAFPDGAPGLTRAIQAEEAAADIPAQTEILTEAVMRFPLAGGRAAALDALLRAMMAGLGPYSRLAVPAELVPPPASVGLELSMTQGQLTVVRPLPGGPGERAGIKPGDVIESIDGRASKDLPLPEAVSALRGEVGTSPTLFIKRAGVATPLIVRPVRGPVQPPPSLVWDLNGATAVIRIGAFDRSTAESLRAALKGAAMRADAPLAGVVLDLRGNAGGLLDVAEDVGGMLLKRGVRIATLRGRNEANARKLIARQPNITAGLPMVVLVDGQTGAGAEIVTAALQDHGRALVIGRPTAGAGTIQTVLPLPEGRGALIVTSARVYRANGARLEGTGVTPDLLLDPATRQLTVRPDIAPDFNTAVQKQVAEAVTTAPPGTDPTLSAALAAITAAAPR
ncbi:hypothetical protein ASB57_02390 [Bordetella sp. N]|nr:hypothetical protein ASB57_02390 [Bordetella sp. N]